MNCSVPFEGFAPNDNSLRNSTIKLKIFPSLVLSTTIVSRLSYGWRPKFSLGKQKSSFTLIDDEKEETCLSPEDKRLVYKKKASPYNRDDTKEEVLGVKSTLHYLVSDRETINWLVLAQRIKSTNSWLLFS